MSSTVLRREGDTVHLEHKYYGRFKFHVGTSLSDAAAASAEVFAGERTDGQLPRRVAIKLDTGGQVYNDHMHWRDTYHSETTRFPGLPWILPQTLPEAPWGDAKVDVMISELLGDSLETIRRRSPTHSLPPRAVCCVAIQCLDMLEALHTKAQLVHRDIKPANLLLPLAATPPQQLHLIDFGIAGKISARGADVAQNPDGTALYSHRGAALKQPISFRDDLEALGYTLLHLAAGALPWEELALKTVAKKAATQRLLDVAKLKQTQLAAGIAAVHAAPLAAALTARAYFAALGLGSRAENAARFEYAPLRALFAGAYAELAGVPFAGGLDLTAPAEEGAAGGSESVRKRKRAPAAAASPAAAPAEEAKEAAPKRRRSVSAAAASPPAQQRTLRPRTARQLAPRAESPEEQAPPRRRR